MKSISKLCILAIGSIIFTATAFAQGTNYYIGKGPATPVVFTVPSSISINNHTSTTFDVTIADTDEYWHVVGSTWTAVYAGDTQGSILITSLYSGGQIYYDRLYSSGNASEITVHYALTADVTGTPPGSVILVVYQFQFRTF